MTTEDDCYSFTMTTKTKKATAELVLTIGAVQSNGKTGGFGDRRRGH